MFQTLPLVPAARNLVPEAKQKFSFADSEF